MEKIKIVHIINSLNVGGEQQIVTDICNGLDRDCFEVTLITLSNQFQNLLPKIQPHVCVEMLPFQYTSMSSPKVLVQQYRLLKNLLKKIDPDIVHVSLYAARLFMLAQCCRKHTRNRLLVKTEHSLRHSTPTLSWKKKLSIQLEKWALKSCCSYLTTVSEPSFQSNQKLFAKHVKEVVLIPNGVDTTVFNPENYSTKKNDFGFNPQDLLFIYVGSLVPGKGHDTLLDAWQKALPILKLQGENAHLLLLGEGSERASIEAFLQSQQLTSTVTLTGNVSNVPEYLSIADIALMPSTSESFGLTSVEAMLMNLPLIASDIPVNRLLINEKRNGLLFPVNDSQSLADSLVYLAKNKKPAQQMGTAGREYALQNYSLEKMVEGYHFFYKKLIPSHP